MKKLLALLLALVMILSLAACGGKEEAEEKDDKKSSASEEKKEDKEPAESKDDKEENEDKEPAKKDEEDEEPVEDPTEKKEESKKESDYEKVMALLAEYDEYLDEAIEAYAVGGDEAAMEVMEEAADLEAEIDELINNGDLSDEEYEAVLAELMAMMEKLASLEESAPAAESDYDKAMALLAEYDAVMDEVIELIEAEGIEAEDPELEAEMVAIQDEINALLENGDMTDAELEEVATVYMEIVSKLMAYMQ